MANALNNVQIEFATEGLVLHQALHGYSEGHRLLESSIAIPDDLKPLMRRMSDLSGTSVVSGFQDYLTGYPLASLEAYAIAKTWYAPEMPRPGCVWTHTFIVPTRVMSRIVSLSTIVPLFRRPSGRSIGDFYSKTVVMNSEPLGRGSESDLQHRAKLQELLAIHYQEDFCPIIVPAATSEEYADLIFAVWSQKWPTLRIKFSFCTGSLSARTFENRPLDVQCVPIISSRQVCREVSDSGFGDPMVLDSVLPVLPQWSNLAADDALQYEGGPVRSFLWSVSDGESARGDFQSFMKIYDAILASLPFSDLLELTAELFPVSENGRRLKKFVFGDQSAVSISHVDEPESILAFATTKSYESFDPEDLGLNSRATRLLAEQPRLAYLLLGDLFRASLNPTGDEILRTLIAGMGAQDALSFASDQQQFLPALFRANPALASSAELWRIAKDRKRELFESLVGSTRIESETIRGIVCALLDSNSDIFIGRAFQEWSAVAIQSALDWVDAHDGSMTDTCRSALASHFKEVADWLATNRQISNDTLASMAHIVAPRVREIARTDAAPWLRALVAMRHTNRKEDENYLAALVLALALCNAPPKPLDLVAESFERVHWLAEKEQLRDDAWSIVQPLVPELSWWKNWDKCERMRRALISAFAKYAWPAWELRARIKNQYLVEQLLDSAKRVDAGNYFRNC